MLRTLLTLILAATAAAPSEAEELAWIPLEPLRAEAGDDSRLDLLDDGSVLWSAGSGSRPTLVLDLANELEGVTAVRIEALLDQRLPQGGPGRGPTGGFKLSDLRVTSAGTRTSRNFFESIVVAAAALDDSAGGPPRHAIDGSPLTAWGPDSGGAPQAAAFVLEGPLPENRDGALRLELTHDHRDGHALGRLRVSVAAHPDPAAALGLTGDEQSAELDARVRRAIEGGVRYLLRQQHLDGSWRFQEDAYPTGSTALAVYTLLRCGLPTSHPSVERAVQFLLPRRPRKTYATAMQLMALGLHGGPRHTGALEERVEDLLDWQTRGGWSYPGHWTDPLDKGHPPDLSITQYALLGLRAAALAGVEVPKKVWRDALRWTLDHQEQVSGYAPAGFFYAPGRDVTGSMTAAGLTALGVLRDRTGEESRSARDAAERALDWLAREFTVTRNPRPSLGGAVHGEDKWTLYYLYGLERVGGLFGLDAFGPHRWYERGATSLLEVQRDDGSWFPPQYGEPQQEIPDTCFALLFLSRATRAAATGQVDPTRRLPREAADASTGLETRGTGDGPFRVWIANLDEALLEDLGWPDDGGLRVERARWETVEPDGTPLEEVAEVVVDPEADSRFVRFTARVLFERPGRHRVRPVLTLLDPDGTRVEVTGPTLELEQVFAAHEALPRYAVDGTRNLLSEFELESLEASSVLGDSWAASKAVDGRQIHGWCSADADTEPWIRLDLGRGVRADTLLLSPLQEPWTTDPWRTGLPARCVATINGSREVEFECVPDRWFKTEVSLGKPVRIRQLEVRVLSSIGVHPAHAELAGVGFAELELVMADR